MRRDQFFVFFFFFFFQAEDGIRDKLVTGVQTCALPICDRPARAERPNLRPHHPTSGGGRADAEPIRPFAQAARLGPRCLAIRSTRSESAITRLLHAFSICALGRDLLVDRRCTFLESGTRRSALELPALSAATLAEAGVTAKGKLPD